MLVREGKAVVTVMTAMPALHSSTVRVLSKGGSLHTAGRATRSVPGSAPHLQLAVEEGEGVVDAHELVVQQVHHPGLLLQLPQRRVQLLAGVLQKVQRFLYASEVWSNVGCTTQSTSLLLLSVLTLRYNTAIQQQLSLQQLLG